MADTKVAKVENYTAEQTTMMVEKYVANPSQITVETLAEKLGRTTKSIIAKLAREKVYVKKVRTTKMGEPVKKKDAHADAIGAILKLTEAEITSLTSANKTALVKIFEALANSVPMTPENCGE